MVSEVVMPQMGADMKEGTLVRWLKSEGDQVDRGEIVAEIETDKANVEIEAFDRGLFRKALAHEGDTVPVGDVIAIVADPDEDISKYEPATQPESKAGTKEASARTETAKAPAPPSEPLAEEIEAKEASAKTETQKAPAPPSEPPAEETEAKEASAKTETGKAPAPPSEPPAEEAEAKQPTEPPAVAAEPTAERTEEQQPTAETGEHRRADHHADGHLRASPVARRIAEEHGIDLSHIEGSGPEGRIVKRDVEAAVESTLEMAPAAPVTAPVTPGPRAAKDDVEEVSLSRMRATIARRMQQSKQNAPHYYLADEADVTDLFYIREQINEALAEKERVSVNDLILMATARALTQHPRFNGQWVEDRLQIHAHINLGVAIALDDGLVAPAILDCAHKGLRQIATEARQLAERARRGTLKAEEHSAGTFTVSNIGPFDIASIVPIINPPQVAIVGIGAAREKPVVRNGEIVVRQLMSIVLAADHRATDGAEGARFLATLRRYLEVPVLMLA